MEEIEMWMDEVEMKLKYEENGKDMESVKKMMKRKNMIEEDVKSKIEDVEKVKDNEEEFKRYNKLMGEEIKER